MKAKSLLKSVAVTIYVIAAIALSGCQDDQFIPDLEKEKPNLQTSAASEVKDLSATLNANILDNGGAAISDRGFYLSTQSDPRTGTRIGAIAQGSSFSAQASSLIPQTVYYVQAYATNSVGTGYGQVISFVTGKTPVQTKVETGQNNTESAFTEATLKAKLANPDNLAISQKGFILASDAKLSSGKRDIPVSGDKFEAKANGLQKDTKYYFCAYAKTELGTTYGDTLSLKTAVFELEGDYYHSVIIGSQEWIVENLHVTKFRNGEAIPNVKDNQAWAALNTPAYCAYENNEAIADTCGYLYNHYVVQDARGLGPEGWKVASQTEIAKLTDYLGKTYVAGLAMMSTTGWKNIPADYKITGSSGFTLKPAGWRPNSFDRLGVEAGIWTNTVAGNGAVVMVVGSDHLAPTVTGIYPYKSGFSLRLIKE